MCRVTFDILNVKEQQEKNIVAVVVDDAPAVDVVDDAPAVDVVDVDMCSTFSR